MRFRARAHRDPAPLHARGIVDRYEIEAGGRRIDDSVVPVSAGVDADAAGRELLFTGLGRDAFGFPTGGGFDSVAFPANGDFVGAGGYKLVGGLLSTEQIWIDELASGEVRKLAVPSYKEVVFSPDFSKAAAMKRKVTVVDTTTGETLTVFAGHGDAFVWTARGASALAFAPTGGEIATGGLKGHVRIWHPTTGAERLAFRAHDGEVLGLAWSADGRWLATSGTDNSVRLWDARSARHLAELPGSRLRRAQNLAFSPDGTTLVINQGTHVEQWRIQPVPGPGTVPAGLTLVLDDVFLLPYFESRWPHSPAVAFSPNGELVAASNGALVLYEVAQRRVAARVTPLNYQNDWHENDAVLALAFGPGGESLVTGSAQGVHLWPVVRLLAQ